MNNNYLKTVANIILLATVFCFVNCDLFKNKRESPTAIKLIYHLALPKPNGEVIHQDDSLNIYYDGNYIVYQIPSEFTYYKMKKNADSQIVVDRRLRTEIKFSYLICRKKNRYGYRFDSSEATKSVKVSVDSFLVKRAFKNSQFFNKDAKALSETISGANDDIQITKYFYKTKPDDSYPDTAYYYFDKKLRSVDYSFSRELDSVKRSKLVKVRFLYNAVIKGQIYYGAAMLADIPKREFVFEISPIPPADKALSSFIAQFKSKEKELYPGN